MGLQAPRYIRQMSMYQTGEGVMNGTARSADFVPRPV